MILETKRLTLREMTLNDVDDLLEIFFDPQTMQFYPQPFSLINPTNLASRRVAEKNGMSSVKEMDWRGKPTCVYAVQQAIACL